MTDATFDNVPLSNLRENDYNPRERFDDAAMEDLKESIKLNGLIQPPTVRPLGNGTYEVISGTRRYKALSAIYDGDETVPVYVRDVDDDEARWIAISENLERENLDPIEKARAYASYVWVSPEGDRVDFDEYIKEARGRDTTIVVPHHTNNESVQELAEKVPATNREIANRLELLALPEKVQTMIQQEELTVTAGMEISRLRQIPDAERRKKLMEDLAQEDQYRGSNPSMEDLRNRVNTYLDDYEEQQEQQQNRVEEFEALVNQRESDLQVKIKNLVEWYNDQDFEDNLSSNGETEIAAAAQSVIDALQDRINALGGSELDALDDREDKARLEKERLQENLQVVRSEGHSRCPFCKAGVRAQDLEDRIKRYDREIEDVRQEKKKISDRRETLRQKRRDLRSAVNDYEEAVDRLEEEKARAGVE